MEMGIETLKVNPYKIEYKRSAQTYPAKCLLVLWLLLDTVETAHGGCKTIYVKGAASYPGLIGYYTDYSTCNGYTTWWKDDSYYPTYYIAYRYSSSTNYWVIRQLGCTDGGVYARHPNSSRYSYPHDLPGYWQEWNGLSYATNHFLAVRCTDSDLSGWEIFLIVAGSILLLIFLCGIVVFYKKRRAAARAERERTAAWAEQQRAAARAEQQRAAARAEQKRAAARAEQQRTAAWAEQQRAAVRTEQKRAAARRAQSNDHRPTKTNLQVLTIATVSLSVENETILFKSEAAFIQCPSSNPIILEE